MSETATTEVEKTATTTAADTTTATTTVADTTAATTTAADTTTATTTAADTTTTETTETATSTLPENWRELAAGNDEKVAALLKRYGSLNGVAKALKEKDDLIRSGKLKRDMPDPKDEKALAEWRKEQGIPDEPTGYKLPEAVTKRVTDADKPMLSSFTEFAHAKGAPQQVVDIATEWYVSMAEAQAEEQAARDTSATEDAEDELRKDWAHGEFKSNMTLAKRFMEQAPEVGANWTEARLPDGRRLGDIAKFVAWASDQGRDKFGDATFATEDSAAKHTARKEEIQKVMRTDIDKYYADGLDKELSVILEKEEKRKK